jgi:hypothetical protein
MVKKLLFLLKKPYSNTFLPYWSYLIINLNSIFTQNRSPKLPNQNLIMLLPNQKIIELATQKYISPIAVLGSHLEKMITIINTENGTLFHMSHDASYAFKDKDGNHWHTILKCFPFDGKLYYPILGDKYILNEKMTIHFTTKEAIIEIAAAYFDEFLVYKHENKTINQNDFFTLTETTPDNCTIFFNT